MENIEELIEKARAGDTRAENELFLKFRARISNLVQSLVRNPEDAKDVLQEVLTTVFMKYKDTEFTNGPFAWIHGVIYNKVKNHRRKCAHAPIRQELDGMENGSHCPEELYEGRELREIIQKAVARLSGKHKIILKAFLEDDIKSYITQRSLTTPIGTIYSDICRFRRQLKKLIKQEGYKRWSA